MQIKKGMESLKGLFLMMFFLWLFLLSIKLLGGTFKHYFSADADGLIMNATSNPLVSLFIGVLATAIIQSSSSTTSIIIAFVGSGALSYLNAVPMIMGANIGTSITGIIVSFGNIRNRLEFKRAFSSAIVHDFFNWLTVFILLPLEMYTRIISKSARSLMEFCIGSGAGATFKSPLDAVVKTIAKKIEFTVAGVFGNPLVEKVIGGKPKTIPDYDWILLVVMIILSLALLFVALKYMSQIMKKVLIGRFEKIIHKYVFKRIATALLFGILFTMSVQSSSITISLVVPLVGAGILTLEKIFPYAVGANIGTTITGILASMVTGNPAGISIALVHTIFNISGAAIFIPLRFIPIGAATWFSEKAAENRLWAFGYIALMFFVIPLTVMTVF